MTCAVAGAACGGDDGGRSEPGGLTPGGVAEATRTIEAARTCAAAYDAGADLVRQLTEGRRRSVPDERDAQLEAALGRADAAMRGRIRTLGCTRSGDVCAELARRPGVDRAALEC